MFYQCQQCILERDTTLSILLSILDLTLTSTQTSPLYFNRSAFWQISDKYSPGQNLLGLQVSRRRGLGTESMKCFQWVQEGQLWFLCYDRLQFVYTICVQPSGPRNQFSEKFYLWNRIWDSGQREVFLSGAGSWRSASSLQYYYLLIWYNPVTLMEHWLLHCCTQHIIYFLTSKKNFDFRENFWSRLELFYLDNNNTPRFW